MVEGLKPHLPVHSFLGVELLCRQSLYVLNPVEQADYQTCNMKLEGSVLEKNEVVSINRYII